jgi:hypothetical protein
MRVITPPTTLAPKFSRLALAVLAVSVTAGAARAEPDANLDSAQRILALAMGESRDGVVVRIALKATKDPELVPLFAKIQQSKAPGAQLDANLAIVMATRDPKNLDINLLLAFKDDVRIGGALAQLIDNNQISDAQLKMVMERESLELAHRVLAASELLHRKALPDHSVLVKALERPISDVDRGDIVRHYAAVSLLMNKDEKENALALKTLNDMLAPRDRRLEQVQELMLLRIYKDKVTLALPWVKTIAQDFDPAGPKTDDPPKERVSPRLAKAALATLLALGDPGAPKILEGQILARREMVDQLNLGLIAIEYADKLKPANLERLGAGKSLPLMKAVVDAANKAVAASGPDNEQAVTDAIMALAQDGQPIVLTWALGYSQTAPKSRQLALREMLIKQATILDDVRGPDYERAAAAANRLIEDDGEDGRKIVAGIIASNNRGAVEAALLGILRSDAKDLSSLIPAKVYTGLCSSATNENAANYATLVLAREGKQEALPWLGGMINGGSVQNIGFRALAAWYYAKLKGQSSAVLDRVMAADATTKPK